jgi:hypothetical protein
MIRLHWGIGVYPLMTDYAKGGLVFFLGLDLPLHRARPVGFAGPSRRLMDQVGGKIFLGLLCQQQPRLRHVDQQHSISRIGNTLCDPQALYSVATVLIY